MLRVCSSIKSKLTNSRLNIFNNREIVIQLLNINGLFLKHTSFKKDREMVLIAVKQNGCAMWHADKELCSDKELLLEAVKTDPNVLHCVYMAPNINTKEFLLEAVKYDGMLLKSISADHIDKDIVLIAVKQNGLALQYAHQFQADKEVAYEAVKQNGKSIVYFKMEMIDEDKKILFEANKGKRKLLGPQIDANGYILNVKQNVEIM